MTAVTARNGDLVRLVNLALAGPVAGSISLVPQTVNLVLYGGDDVTIQLEVTDADGLPLDLDGVTVASQVRETQASETVAGEFDATTGAPGTAWLHLGPQESQALPARGVWDVRFTWDDGGIMTRRQTLAAGSVTVYPGVTR